MDTSNRLGFLLGDLRVSPREVTPEEWFQVIGRMRDLIKPWLSKLHGFSEIGERLNCQIGSYSRRITAEDKISFSQGVSAKTRVAHIADLDHRTTGSHPQGGVAGFAKRDLLLVQNGEWICWSGRYERCSSSGHGFTGRHKAMDEVALESIFSLVLEAEFLDMLKDWRVGAGILVALRDLVRGTLQDRRNFLRRLEGIELSFERGFDVFENRLEFFS